MFASIVSAMPKPLTHGRRSWIRCRPACGFDCHPKRCRSFCLGVSALPVSAGLWPKSLATCHCPVKSGGAFSGALFNGLQFGLAHQRFLLGPVVCDFGAFAFSVPTQVHCRERRRSRRAKVLSHRLPPKARSVRDAAAPGLEMADFLGDFAPEQRPALQPRSCLSPSRSMR